MSQFASVSLFLDKVQDKYHLQNDVHISARIVLTAISSFNNLYNPDTCFIIQNDTVKATWYNTKDDLLLSKGVLESVSRWEVKKKKNVFAFDVDHMEISQ